MADPAAEGQAPQGAETNLGVETPTFGNVPPVKPETAPAADPVVEPKVETEGEPKAEPLVAPPSAVVDEVPSNTGDDGVVTYEETSDAGLNVALAFVGKMGIAGNDPAMVAAANGNFSLIEAQLATLGDKAQGWQQMVALAKEAFARSETMAVEASAAIDKAVVAVVGSAENWKAISTWAAGTATPEEKASINAMLDAGPFQARAAASILLEAYSKAKGTIVNPASVSRNASGDTVQTNTKLTPREYHAQVGELHRKLGSRMEASPEYRALQSRLA